MKVEISVLKVKVKLGLFKVKVKKRKKERKKSKYMKNENRICKRKRKLIQVCGGRLLGGTHSSAHIGCVEDEN